jgi:hypothetical protein
VGQPLIVQVSKEPISTKGSRLVSEISLAGRNIVLLPFADKVSVSQKIKSKQEKKRLELLVKNILPKNYGAIIRTAAEGKSASVLDNELMSLIEKWENSWVKLSKDKSVKLLFTESNKVTSMLRDLLDESFTNIVVNDKATAGDLRVYISNIAPGMEKLFVLATTYFLCGLNEVVVGASRGMGASFSPMLVSIFGICGVRSLWALVIFPLHPTVALLHVAFPVSWGLTFLIQIPINRRAKRRLVESGKTVLS